MDEVRYRKVKYLARCSFLPGSYEKRFVRDMASHPSDTELTIRQTHYIDLLYWHYRKQIAAMDGDDKPDVFRPGEIDDLVDEKPGRAARPRRNKQAEAQTRIDEWNAKVMGEKRE